MGTTTASIAAVMTRFLPSTSATAPVKGERARGHDGADLGGADTELAGQRRQQRLRRVEVEEGTEAGDGYGDVAGVDRHYC